MRDEHGRRETRTEKENREIAIEIECEDRGEDAIECESEHGDIIGECEWIDIDIYERVFPSCQTTG